MTVYIDSWGHLFSDQSVRELWSVASRIGMRAEWNHYSKGFPHFDLTTEGKKMLAVAHGAKHLSVRDAEWRITVDGMMRATFNRTWHERCAVCQTGTGLVGQKILRLDITATIAREDPPIRERSGPTADAASTNGVDGSADATCSTEGQ